MSKINPVSVAPARVESSHLNFMGGYSWDVSDAVTRLHLAAASCFFGEPMYYHTEAGSKPSKTSHRTRSVRNRPRGLNESQLAYLRETLDAIDPVSWRRLTPKELLESAIDEALDTDVVRTLETAVTLRNEDYIRVTPQVILVRAANHPAVKGTGLIRKYAPLIIKRADEPATQLAYHLATYGKPIPNSLKRAWADAYEHFNDYGLGKYKLAKHVVKSVDVVNIAHPKSESVNKLMNGQLQLSDETWEAYISANGSTKETWTNVITRMPHMALLRNLRNFSDKEVDPDVYIPRLVATQPGSMQLPFRYYSAYKALGSQASPRVLDAVEECLFNSTQDAGIHIPGRTMSLCDNSGSAWSAMTSEMGTMAIAEIANLTAVITGMASDEGYAGVFGDRLQTFGIRKRESLFSQTANLAKSGKKIGGGTEHGIWLFWDRAIRNAEHWDNVFVYSDMQAGHGGLYGNASEYSDYAWPGIGYNSFIDVPKLISTYRNKVNPNVNVFLVQVAGYKDILVPEYYNRTYILGGWGPNILKFATKMTNLAQQ